MFFSQHNGTGGAASGSTLGFNNISASPFANRQQQQPQQHHFAKRSFNLDEALSEMDSSPRQTRRHFPKQQQQQQQQQQHFAKRPLRLDDAFSETDSTPRHTKRHFQQQQQQGHSPHQTFKKNFNQQPHSSHSPFQQPSHQHQHQQNANSAFQQPQQHKPRVRSAQHSVFAQKQFQKSTQSNFAKNHQQRQSQLAEAFGEEDDVMDQFAPLQQPQPHTSSFAQKPSVFQHVQLQPQAFSPFSKNPPLPQHSQQQQQQHSSTFAHSRESFQEQPKQSKPTQSAFKFQKPTKPTFTPHTVINSSAATPAAPVATASPSALKATFKKTMGTQPSMTAQQPVLKKKTLRSASQFSRAESSPSSVSSLGKVTAADRAKRFGATAKSSLYEQFKKDRVREREQAIRDGLIPDPENPTRLEDAIDFRGTCEDKCPEFEMIEREIQNGLDSLEMDEYGNADPDKVVKAYRRSAAGNEQPLPSDVRSPAALVATLDYLIDEVLSKQPLEKCHAFIRDRTRSIRQDFTLQNIRDVTAVHVHERIARFHILCLHEMCEYDESKFSEQQETEQLRKVLLSLMEFYDDLREEGIETENEAEFRAYHLLSHIRDQDLLRQAQTLPVHVFRHPYMKRALEFHALAQRNNEIMETSSRKNKFLNVEASQNNYARFFKLIADQDTPFLMACLLESHFSDVRKGALKAMNMSYQIKVGGVEAEDVRRVLAYDTMSHLLEEAALYGLVIDMSLGQPTLCFGQKHYRTKQALFREPLSNPSQKRSQILVEPKKVGRNFKQIINSDPIDLNSVMTTAALPPSQTVNQQQPLEINVSYTELTGSPPRKVPAPVQIVDEQQMKNTEKEELIRLRNQVQTMEAQVQREKERMAELMKAKEAQKRLQQEKEDKAKKEQERQRQEQLQREAAAAAAAAEEKERKERELKEEQARKAAAMQQELQQQAAKDEMLANLRRKAVKSRTINQIRNTFIEEYIAEAAKERVQKILRARQLIRWRMKSKLLCVRERIAKRNTKMSQWRKTWKADHDSALIKNNPYSKLKKEVVKARGLQLTAQQIRKRIDYCLELEEIALEMYQAKSAEGRETHMASVWKTEDFSFYNIYPRINDKLDGYKEQLQAMTGVPNNDEEEARVNWELLIHVADHQLDSSGWFKRKFGLEENTLQRCDRYVTCDITHRMISPETELSSMQVLDTKAILFSLPEFNPQDKLNYDIDSYWNINRLQLKALMDQLDKYHPGLKVPIVFTYFPSNTPIEKIPHLLDLNNSTKISDWHILLMNPSTIPQRICEEVNWLARKA